MPPPHLFTRYLYSSHTILTAQLPPDHVTRMSQGWKSSWIPSHKHVKHQNATPRERPIHLDSMDDFWIREQCKVPELHITLQHFPRSHCVLCKFALFSLAAPASDLRRHATLLCAGQILATGIRVAPHQIGGKQHTGLPKKLPSSICHCCCPLLKTFWYFRLSKELAP